jgi:hypothetical protein
MRRRFQFSLRALLMAMLIIATFFAGIHFERAWRRRADEAAALAAQRQHVMYFTDDVRIVMPELPQRGE